jgi:arylsulfatase A-like enzyme
VRNDRWKLIYYYGKPLGMTGANPPDTAPDWELFDVRTDPREMHNLYHDPKYAKVVAEMKTLLDKLQKESGDTPV